MAAESSRPNPRGPVDQRRLRFLFVYDAIYPQTLGGVEHRNHELASSLAKRGHEVVLAGWADRSESPAAGVTILPIGRARKLHARSGRRSTLQALRLAWHCARLDIRGFDVVETSNIPFLHLFPLAQRCRRARVPLLVTWHEHWGLYWRQYMPPKGLGRWRLYAAIERRAASRGNRAIAVSRLTADRVAVVRHDEVAVVPNGVPFERIRDLAERPPGSSEVIAAEAAPLVFAGRLIKEKRVDLLLDAVAILARSTPGLLLKIIGDGPERSSLLAQMKRLGLEESVDYAGRLPTSEAVWRHLGRAKVAVQPSAREGFGLFALEAMAAGLPVVYCRSSESAIGELVRDGVEGLEVLAEPSAIAAALDNLLADEEKLRDMAARAIERASGYDWDTAAAALIQIAHELVGQRQQTSDGSLEQTQSDG